VLAGTSALAQQRPDIARHVQMQKKFAEATGTERVIGGAPAEAGAWPWQVGLATTYDLDDSGISQLFAQFCGGSLITPKWVLTAAHCVMSGAGNLFQMAPEDLTILYGDIDLAETRRAEVARIEVHPGYSSFDVESDIALVELKAPLELDGTTVATVKFADAGSDAAEAGPGASAVVTGWGLMGDGNFPQILQEAQLDIQDNHDCSEALVRLYERQFATLLQRVGARLNVNDDVMARAFKTIVEASGEPIPPSMVCAGVPSGARDSCNGDSGGPLVVGSGDDRLQVGIVSWGEVPLEATSSCGHEQLFGYYTRVSSFRDWIDRTIGQ
jgi:secreted trypsin-like serine protease